MRNGAYKLLSSICHSVFYCILFSASVYAREERYLNRSIPAMLMGDAYTALADDEFTLYYNPAILGRHRGFSFMPINPGITVTNPLESDIGEFGDIGSEPSDIADALMNKPIHIGLGAAPGFKLGRFGITAIVNNQTSLNVVNSVTPMLDIDHRYDRGFIMGYGIPLRISGPGQLSLGVSTKYIQRESIFGEYNITSPTLLDAFSSGELDDVLNALGKTKGSGWGFDAGLDYVKQNGPSTFTAGVALLDIYTNLHTDSNEMDREVQPQPMKLNAGAAWKASLGAGFDFTLSADIRNLEQQMEFMRRIRLGVAIGFTPAMSVMAGMNSNQYSYGIKLNSGLLGLTIGFFNVDIGETLGQQVSKRAAIYLTLLDFTFDA